MEQNGITSLSEIEGKIIELGLEKPNWNNIDVENYRNYINSIDYMRQLKLEKPKWDNNINWKNYLEYLYCFEYMRELGMNEPKWDKTIDWENYYNYLQCIDSVRQLKLEKPEWSSETDWGEYMFYLELYEYITKRIDNDAHKQYLSKNKEILEWNPEVKWENVDTSNFKVFLEQSIRAEKLKSKPKPKLEWNIRWLYYELYLDCVEKARELSIKEPEWNDETDWSFYKFYLDCVEKARELHIEEPKWNDETNWEKYYLYLECVKEARRLHIEEPKWNKSIYWDRYFYYLENISYLIFYNEGIVGNYGVYVKLYYYGDINGTEYFKIIEEKLINKKKVLNTSNQAFFLDSHNKRSFIKKGEIDISLLENFDFDKDAIEVNKEKSKKMKKSTKKCLLSATDMAKLGLTVTRENFNKIVSDCYKDASVFSNKSDPKDVAGFNDCIMKGLDIKEFKYYNWCNQQSMLGKEGLFEDWIKMQEKDQESNDNECPICTEDKGPLVRFHSGKSGCDYKLCEECKGRSDNCPGCRGPR